MRINGDEYLIASGALTPRATSSRFAEIRHVLDFGAVGDGVADDAAAIQRAIDAASLDNGGTVQLGHSHKIGTSLLVSHSNVMIRGYGAAGTAGVGTIGAQAATKLTWSGAAAGEMIRFSSIAGDLNQKFVGGGMRGVYFKANALAAIGLAIYSWNSGLFEFLYFEEFSDVGLIMSCVNPLNNAATNQKNVIRGIGCRQYTLSGAGIRLTSPTTYNTSLNRFEDIDLDINDGNGLELYNSDNNLFLRTRVGRAGGGVGNSLVLHGSNSSLAECCRANVFLHFSSGAPIVAKGTATYTYPSKNNTVFFMDRDNGSPEPTVEVGASINYSYGDGLAYDTAMIRGVFADTGAHALTARAYLAANFTGTAAIFMPAFVLSDATAAKVVLTRWTGADPEMVLFSGASDVMFSFFRGLKIGGVQMLGTGNLFAPPMTAPAVPATGWTIYSDAGDSDKLKAKAADGTVVPLRPPHPGYPSGKFFSTVQGAIASAVVAGVDIIYLYAFNLLMPITIASGVARVNTGGAGSAIKAAVYASGANNMPLGAPLIKDETGIATTSSGVTVVLAMTGTLQPGLYWIGSKLTGTLPTMNCLPIGAMQTSFFAGCTTNAVSSANGVSFADAYANAFPTFTGGSSFTALGANGIPVINFGT